MFYKSPSRGIAQAVGAYSMYVKKKKKGSWHTSKQVVLLCGAELSNLFGQSPGAVGVVVAVPGASRTLLVGSSSLRCQL